MRTSQLLCASLFALWAPTASHCASTDTLATGPSLAPEANGVVSARRTYYELVRAFNEGDRARFVALHAASYCHYDKLYAPPTRLPKAYETRLTAEAEGPWIDPQVAVVRANSTRVLFLQTELFMAKNHAPKRFFKLIEMRRTDLGWKLAVTATRARHSCASNVMEGVADARIEALKRQLLADDSIPFNDIDDPDDSPDEGLLVSLTKAHGLSASDRRLLISADGETAALIAHLTGKPGAEMVVTHNPEPDPESAAQESTLWVFARDSRNHWTLRARKTYAMDPMSDGYYEEPPGIRVSALENRLLRVDHIAMRGGADPRYFRHTTHLLDARPDGTMDEVFQCETEAEYVRGANRQVLAERSIQLAWRGDHIVATDRVTKFQTTFRPQANGRYRSLGGPVCRELLDIY